MPSHTNHPRGVRLAYICDITYRGWLTEAVGSKHVRHRGAGGNRRDEAWELVKTDGGCSGEWRQGGSRGAVNGLNSCKKISLVCLTGDKACIHTS
jgi:hypothetical protein